MTEERIWATFASKGIGSLKEEEQQTPVSNSSLESTYPQGSPQPASSDVRQDVSARKARTRQHGCQVSVCEVARELLAALWDAVPVSEKPL